jgi:hypothetical protein
VQARDQIIVQNVAKGIRRQHIIFGHHDRLRFNGGDLVGRRRLSGSRLVTITGRAR